MSHDRLVFVVSFAVVSLLLPSCATSPNKPSSESSPTKWNYNGPHPYQSNLSVQIALNDSVFLLQDILECHRYIDSMKSQWYAYPPKSELYGGFIIPLLSVKVINTGSGALRAPRADCAALPSGHSAEVEWDVGVVGDSQPLRSGYIKQDFFSRHLIEFTDLDSGARRILADSLDIYEYYNLDHVNPGRYWVTAAVQNFRTAESSPPIWTGRVQSDTLYFRLVD